MALTARIVAATLRDLSYIASNLRPEDQAEAECQIPGVNPAMLAAMCLRDHAYVVEVNRNPEAAFGAARCGRDSLWVAWSWGTKRMWRAVPVITEFVRDVMIPQIAAEGGLRCEARAMASHSGARQWLKRMGATERCILPFWGSEGQDFVLYDWTASDVLSRRPDAKGSEHLDGDDGPAGPDRR